MGRLSELQLAALLDEIAAAMKVDKPVVDSMRRLGERRLGSAARSAREITRRLESGENLKDALQVSDSPIIQHAAAAVEISEQSDNPELLNRVANQLRARYEQGRFVQLSWLYPILLLAVAYCVAVFVMAGIVVGNHGRDIAWNDTVVAISHWLTDHWRIPLIGIVALAATVVFRVGARRRIPKSVRQQLFCQSLADQIQAGVPDEQALQASMLMSGEAPVEGTLTLESPVVKSMISDSSLDLPDVVGATRQEMLVANLRYAAAVHHERSRREDYFWGRFLPRIAMVLIGGGLTLAYAWWVIRPVYQQVAKW